MAGGRIGPLPVTGNSGHHPRRPADPVWRNERALNHNTPPAGRPIGATRPAQPKRRPSFSAQPRDKCACAMLEIIVRTRDISYHAVLLRKQERWKASTALDPQRSCLRRSTASLDRLRSCLGLWSLRSAEAQKSPGEPGPFVRTRGADQTSLSSSSSSNITATSPLADRRTVPSSTDATRPPSIK
jgi:hypothetical protein